jgi:creatinine amidohydrolase
MKGVWLQDLTWPEAEEWIKTGRPIVIPVGAIAKEHGAHLPMNTDFLLAQALAEGVARILPVMIAPIISAGYYPAFRHYPGSQHLSPSTFQAAVEETIEGFIHQGVQNISIINTGVSTEPVIKVAVREILERHGVRVWVADIRNLGKRTDPMFEQETGGHGDEHETSIIMAIKPEAVHLERAQTDYGNVLKEQPTVFAPPTIFNPDPDSGIDFSETGVRGDPTLASVIKGEAALEAMIKDLSEGLEIIFPEVLL